LDVLDVSKRDTVEQAKRLFINAITVRVSSEMPLTQYKELYKVQKVITSGPPLIRRGDDFVGVDTVTITQQTGQN
jgi:2,3-bisphosphoglycerate-independent phosphoglycerate mutase